MEEKPTQEQENQETAKDTFGPLILIVDKAVLEKIMQGYKAKAQDAKEKSGDINIIPPIEIDRDQGHVDPLEIAEEDKHV